MKADYEAELWNDREYVAGESGRRYRSACRLTSITHTTDFHTAQKGLRSHALHAITPIVTTAPGESFADTLSPADPLTGYDPTKGVAIRNPTSNYLKDGFELRDNVVDFIGLQIKSDHGIGLGGGADAWRERRHGSQFDRGGRAKVKFPTIKLDTSMLVVNSLVVVHGTFGIDEHFPGTILHSTLVNPDRVPDSFAIDSGFDWIFVGETVSNTAIFGFAHAVGSKTPPGTVRWLGGNNVTDAPPSDSGALALGREGTETARTLPGTIYGSSASEAFRTFPGDYRLGAVSPLIGAGSAFGPFNPACLTGKSCPAIYTFRLSRYHRDRAPTGRPLRCWRLAELPGWG